MNYQLFAALYYIIMLALGIDLSSNNMSSVPLAKSDYSLYTYRLMTRLRKASFLLYQSHPFSLVVSRLEVSLSTIMV